MEEMDIDDYSRDRSRSPVRDRSRSRERRDSNTTSTSASGSRDYKGGSSRDYHGGSSNSRDYGTNRRFEDRRGGYRGGRGGGSYGRRDYGSSASSSPSVRSDGDYRSKTERNYDNSIFISNVPFTSSEKDVESIFKGEFDVKRADIVTNRGRSRGMATVEFSTKEDVRKAIEKFDQFDYHGRPLYVRQDYPPPEKKEYAPRKDDYRSSRDDYRGGRDDYRGGRDDYRGGRDDYRGARDDYRGGREDYRGGRDDYRGGRDDFKGREKREPPPPGTEVFIGNLPFSINWQALKDLMRQAGEVVRADVKLDWSGNSKGFGTVVFSSVAEADKAIEMFQGYEIEGRQLNTRPGKIAGAPPSSGTSSSNGGRDTYTGRERRDGPSGHTNSEFTAGVEGDGEKSDTIYVANLPFVTSNEDLYDLFETVGRTTKAEIQYNDEGKASGNAVVQFELADVAESAIETLNNYTYGERDLRITYAKRP